MMICECATRLGDVVMEKLESSQHGIAFSLEQEPGFMPYVCLLPSQRNKEVLVAMHQPKEPWLAALLS